jgi:5-deoxy-glucuronate isomerase
MLEETYYFRFDRPSGFGFHRNFAPEDRWEQSFPLFDQTLVPVPRGYHLCGTGPAANMWLLNFLAGTPQDRTRSPHFDPNETWIESDWSHGLMTLPAVELPAAPASPTGEQP